MFSDKDLESISRTIEQMHDIVQRGKENNYSPQFLALLEERLNACRDQLSHLHEHLSNLSLELAPTHEKLISILRSIAAANTRRNFPTAEVKAFQSQLKDMENSKVDGIFVAADGTIPAGQQIVNELLGRCQQWAELVLERHGEFDEGFKPTYEKLCDIRNQLEKLTLTQAWSLRETDLFNFQCELDRIDEARVNGEFIDEQGNAANLFCQRTLLYLLRRSYAYIYSLIVSSEPVSEALLPVFNQLQTLRRCLIEVKKSGGVCSPRELYPYSMKLNSIDSMQVSGMFMVGEDIPEGQANVKSLLAECFDLCHDLKVEAEDKGPDP
ncbi:MAG: hypothetical protein M1840_002300 [Geoglossum simile]|nr:MAG: hypothetical protein M1840_002300 [Geoglossum simile]